MEEKLSEDCMQAIQGLGVSQIKQFCRNSQATGYCQPSSASLSASGSVSSKTYLGLSASGQPIYRYNLNVVITESNGVEVTITSVQRNYKYGTTSQSGTLVIPGGSSVTKNFDVDTTAPDTATITYSGADKNDIPVSVSASVPLN